MWIIGVSSSWKGFGLGKGPAPFVFDNFRFDHLQRILLADAPIERHRHRLAARQRQVNQRVERALAGHVGEALTFLGRSLDWSILSEQSYGLVVVRA